MKDIKIHKTAVFQLWSYLYCKDAFRSMKRKHSSSALENKFVRIRQRIGDLVNEEVAIL